LPPQSTHTPDEAENSRRQWAELSQLVSGLAHEIKNPLSTVRLNMRLLAEDLARYNDEEHERLQRRLKLAADEAERVENILRDFLRYAGKVELSLQQADLVDVISELHDFFAPQAAASNVVFRTDLPEQAVMCLLDVGLIKQALLNLMINATQAMQGRGGELLIRLGHRDGWVNIEVIDTGPGIPPENIEGIFDAYWSTKADGSGLGLPTARRIVREHHGRLSVDSEVGKGTRFVIALPVDDGASESSSTPSPPTDNIDG
jgi:signal transduction histidine kinase